MIGRKYLTTIYRNSSNWVGKTKSTSLSSQFCKEFKDFYPKFLDKGMQQSQYFHHPLIKSKLKKLSEYFVHEKFPCQGEFLIYAYELLEKPKNITNDKLQQVYALAATFEMFQSYFLFQDDVYDNSEMRSGKPCWHLLPEASPMALNDSSILRCFINELLINNMDKSINIKLVDFYNDMYLALEVGQLMDVEIGLSRDYNNYTMKTYENFTYLKGSDYCMNAPMLLALILIDKANESTFQLVKDLFDDLGVLFAIHNDFTEYLDYDENFTMKSNTDIRNGKCAWPAVVALEVFNAEQRKIFNQCYGQPDPEKIKRVVKLYDEVNMRELYQKEANTRYETFLRKVNQLPPDTFPSPEFFKKILKFFQGYAGNTSRYYFI